MTLPAKPLKRKIVSLDSVDSTNAYAASLSDAEEGTVVVAQEQTAGRGRLGRSWLSEKGKNLTFSVILKPGSPAEIGGLVSLLAGLAVAETLGSVGGLSPECKWPNDVLLGGRKVCGILTESTITGGTLTRAIVGIGLNVNQTAFPGDLQPPPTSLMIETGHEFNLTAVLSALLGTLERRYSDFRTGKYDTIIREWKKLSTTIGQTLSIKTGEGEIRGLATGVAPDGALLVEVNGSQRKIHAADITILR
jgi:BirA family biotin operon repressor/biotin-[acetyl-CoA-carboxylase] ligase